MKNRICQTVKNLPFIEQIPDFIAINYDEWLLRVILSFQANHTVQRVYIDFNNIIGFRLLDEGNLVEFWQDDCPQGWLWQVLQGGWYDLEYQRQGFITAMIYGNDKNKPLEFLVLSQNSCVSVITFNQPTLYQI